MRSIFIMQCLILLLALTAFRECAGFIVKYNTSSTELQEKENEKRTLKDVFHWNTASYAQSTPAPPSGSKLGIYDHGAVASDGNPCSSIGVTVMKTNGSTVDATIASLFCLGVVVQESMGMGGGFFLIYYDKPLRQIFALDAREMAPQKATENMFDGDPEISAFGGLSIAVPGEVRGYWELYKKFGGPSSWASLIQPTIEICEQGFPVSKHMAHALQSKRTRILSQPTMSIFVNPETGDVFQKGDIIFRPDLANTLRALQSDPDSLYTGALSEGFLRDLQNSGSIITRADLENYRPVWRTPVEVSLANGNLKMHSLPPPSSGIILGLILNVLDDYKFNSQSLNEENIVTTNQRITEALKYGYAKRTDLGDEDFVDMTPINFLLTSEGYAKNINSKINDTNTSQDPKYYGAVTYAPETHGTSHLSVWGDDGSVIGVTSTINLFFGASIASPSTGIVLNDEMDDFSSPNITNSFGLPPSPANFIRPGKRPQSSMCPAIFTDSKGDVRLVVGAAGGSMITSATAWTSIQNLWFGKDMKQAIDSRRLHHQLFPMVLFDEEGFQQSVVKGLEDIGHITEKFEMGESVVTGIALGEDGKLYANSDFRKGNDVDGF